MAGHQDQERWPLFRFLLFSTPAGIQICDQIGHVPTVKTRPANALALHLFQHTRPVMPERRRHRDPSERTCSLRRICGGAAMARHAVLRSEDAFPTTWISRVLEELPRP